MAVQAPPRQDSARWAYFRLGLAVMLMLVLAAILLFGERPTSMNDFDRAVAAGRVDTVRVVGEMPVGVSGSSIVELHWRDGVIARVAQVRQVKSQGSVSPDSSVAAAGGDRVFVGDVVGQLAGAHPGLRVISEPDVVGQVPSKATAMGWSVSGWIVLALLVNGLLTLALLLGGPEPWWATRWAWFWLIAHPLGIVGGFAFLLLSGPTPLLPTPKTGSRRLRGGWAFAITALIAGLWRG